MTEPARFHPTSLGDWLELCAETDIPHVPAVRVATVERDDWLHFDQDGPHQKRLAAAASAISQAVAGGDRWMVRADHCAPLDLKANLSAGDTAWTPSYHMLLWDDPRAFELLMEYPRPVVPVWARPWIDNVDKVDSYPVEYRAFVRDGELIGISNYYPQRPLPHRQQDVSTVTALTERLLDNIHPPLMWGSPRFTPELQHPPLLDLEGVHFTADFLVADKTVYFLEGGPPHEFGAHPCCFRPGDIEGLALSDRNRPRRQKP